MLGEGGRKFVLVLISEIPLRGWYWEQLQVAEFQPKSLQKRRGTPSTTAEQWLFKLEGASKPDLEGEAGERGWGGRQGFEKLSLGSRAYLIGLEHMSSRLKNSQPAR